MTRTTATRRIAGALLTAALGLALTACSANPLTVLKAGITSPTIDEAAKARQVSVADRPSAPVIKQDGVLTVGLPSTSSAPMLVTGTGGGLDGFDVDVAYAIAEQLGLSASFVTVGDGAASANDCDVVMSARADSAGDLTVVGSYAESATAFFHKGAETTVTSQDLAGKRVGVQGGSASQQLLKRTDLSVSVQEFENLNAAFEALEAGQVDYVLCDALSGAYLQGGYSDLSFAGTLDVPSAVGVGVSSANAELQTYVKGAVDKVTSGGVAEVLRSKWLGGMCSLTDTTKVSGVTIGSAPTTTGATTGAPASTTATSVESVTGTGPSGTQDGSGAGANAASVTG